MTITSKVTGERFEKLQQITTC